MNHVMSRSTLFSGCAVEHAGAPARQATIALARELVIELWEAPSAGCCGARADLQVGEATVRRLVVPLYEAARQGLRITCLSPACRRVVAAHAPTAPRPEPAADPDHESVPQVCDVVQLLSQHAVLERLAHAVRAPLYPLRVAFHGVCHGDHVALQEEHPRMSIAAGARADGVEDDPGVSDLPATPDAVPAADPALAQLITASGATPMHDVSVLGHCAGTPVAPGQARTGTGAPAPACLTLAARAGADVLVTPCFLCFGYLNDLQRRLERGDPARSVPVLHLSQLLGLACGVAPSRLELDRLAVPSRQVFTPFII